MSEFEPPQFEEVTPIILAAEESEVEELSADEKWRYIAEVVQQVRFDPELVAQRRRNQSKSPLASYLNHRRIVGR